MIPDCFEKKIKIFKIDNNCISLAINFYLTVHAENYIIQKNFSHIFWNSISF